MAIDVKPERELFRAGFPRRHAGRLRFPGILEHVGDLPVPARPSRSTLVNRTAARALRDRS